MLATNKLTISQAQYDALSQRFAAVLERARQELRSDVNEIFGNEGAWTFVHLDHFLSQDWDYVEDVLNERFDVHDSAPPPSAESWLSELIADYDDVPDAIDWQIEAAIEEHFDLVGVSHG